MNAQFFGNNAKKAWRKIEDGRIKMYDYLQQVVLEAAAKALICQG